MAHPAVLDIRRSQLGAGVRRHFRTTPTLKTKAHAAGARGLCMRMDVSAREGLPSASAAARTAGGRARLGFLLPLLALGLRRLRQRLPGLLELLLRLIELLGE